MRVDSRNRDELAALAARLGGVSLDEALAILLFERRVMDQFAALGEDQAEYAEYLAQNEPWPRSTLPSAIEAKLAPWQVWWVDFDPQLGREQAGLRPAIVVSTPFTDGRFAGRTFTTRVVLSPRDPQLCTASGVVEIDYVDDLAG